MSGKKKPASTEVVTYAKPPLLLASGDSVAGLYRIEEHYGAGPLGHTFRAFDATGGRVAVKIVSHQLVPTIAERQSMVAEVQKLVGQNFSRVATPVDAGIENGAVYVVSPWVNGRSLRRVLGAYRDAGRVTPPEEILGIIEGVVLALRQLHTVAAHGALYPESVQISKEGTVVLTDAGIAGGVARARLIDHYEGYPDVMPYLSPEIRGGKHSSAGSDLYSVGALASELLTGDPGAAAAGIAGPMMPGYPKEIDAALQGLVALKSARRAAALPALVSGLASVIASKSVPLTSALPRRRAPTEMSPPVVELPRPRRRRANSG